METTLSNNINDHRIATSKNKRLMDFDGNSLVRLTLQNNRLHIEPLHRRINVHGTRLYSLFNIVKNDSPKRDYFDAATQKTESYPNGTIVPNANLQNMMNSEGYLLIKAEDLFLAVKAARMQGGNLKAFTEESQLLLALIETRTANTPLRPKTPHRPNAPALTRA